MRAALVMVDWNTGQSYCHILHGEDPLGDAHKMYAQVHKDFPDCEFAFLADDAAKRRYGDRVFKRGAGLPLTHKPQNKEVLHQIRNLESNKDATFG